MKAILIKEIGTRHSLRIYWGDGCTPYGCHNATKHLGDTLVKLDKSYGVPADYASEEWPINCDHCGCAVPIDEVTKQVFTTQDYMIRHRENRAGKFILYRLVSG